MNTESTSLAVFFWQNINQMLNLLALDAEQLNDADKNELQQIAESLTLLEKTQQFELLPIVADLVLESREDLKAHYTPPQRLSLATNVELLNEVWQAVKADDVAMIVLYLRLLGQNKIDAKLFKYEGSSIFADLKKLLSKQDKTDHD
jgi:hypothetical protein